jgi:hypothetical protein
VLQALAAAKPFPARENLLSLLAKVAYTPHRGGGDGGEQEEGGGQRRQAEVSFLRLHNALYTRIGLDQMEVNSYEFM